MATRAVLAPSERTKIVFGRGYAPDPAGELTLLLQLYVVMQIFKISASEYLKYTRKYAILTLNNQKFSAEGVLKPNSRRGGEHPLPAPHPPQRLRRLDPQSIPALFPFHFKPWMPILPIGAKNPLP